MKTIVQVWTHKCVNQSGFWGIGDALRGTIQAYLLCKKMGYKFYVDTTLHMIHKYIVTQQHPYSNLIDSLKGEIFMIPANHNLEKKILELPEGVHCFFTNALCTEYIDEECKDFIKKLLTPEPSLEEEVRKVRECIPFDSYSILHFRLGDDELVYKKHTEVSNSIIQKIRLNKDTKSVLISDSNILKKHHDVIKEVFVLQTKPSHIGTLNNDESIKDSLVDFILVTRSSRIKTYSCYDWISGFVMWASKIYDIPIETIN
jgi:hypothetical protein